MKVPLNIFGGFYESQSAPLSSQNCINWIPVISEDAALAQGSLLTAKGLTAFATAGTTANRGSIKVDSVPYFVNGTSLYSVNSSGVVTTIGAINGTGRVSMASSFTDVGIKICIVVPGGTAYVYDGTTLTTISDTDYVASDTVIYNDGFFVFSRSSGDKFFHSELNNPSSIRAEDVGTAEISPDKIVAVHANHNEVFVLGEDTIEIFKNIGGSGFVYQRINGANMQQGCASKFSIVDFDNTFLFVGGGLNEKAGVWRVVSSQSAQKISTDAIDTAIQKFTETEISNSFAFTYTIDGQFIAGFTFESDTIPSVTFCYNGTSKKWFQMQSGLSPNRWRVNSIVSAYGKLLVGDSDNGQIGYLDEVNSEYGSTIKRVRTGQPFFTGTSQYWPEIEVTMETGTGLTNDLDPQIRMSFSDDGGRTFSPERSKSFGKIGKYGKRTIWYRNGRVPSHRLIRLVVTDPVVANILRMDGVIEQGY